MAVEDHDPRFDPSKRERAAALYNEGRSIREVAEAMGVSTRRAWEFVDWAAEHGLVTKRAPGRPRKAAEEE